MKKGDWIEFQLGGVGIIKRIAKDKSWADIWCGAWSKRVPNPEINLKPYHREVIEQ